MTTLLCVASLLDETTHLNVYTKVCCGNILDLSFLKMLDPCPWRESRGGHGKRRRKGVRKGIEWKVEERKVKGTKMDSKQCRVRGKGNEGDVQGEGKGDRYMEEMVEGEG